MNISQIIRIFLFTKALRTVGKWVQWNNSRPMSGCPTGSILGGKFNGWWCCVARIDGLGGEYCPKVGHATVNYKGDVKTAANFEVNISDEKT